MAIIIKILSLAALLLISGAYFLWVANEAKALSLAHALFVWGFCIGAYVVVIMLLKTIYEILKPR